ncbi:hypothetical protein F5X99DRAFT_210855 [Biscogniauxia marginata]|nr:hypothetical protein F5X99DRAFT_210855 [Biscogniauxia marginata]
MGKHDYPYKKGVNVTAWVLQIIVCLILLGASAWLLSLISSDDYDYVLGEYDGFFTAAAGLQIALTGLTIVFDIVEIVLIARKSMPPALYLSSACIKTAVWGIIFILNLIAVSILSIILCGILLATSLLQLVYGARLVHRKRKGTLTSGNYAPAPNPALDGNTGNVEAGYSSAYGQPQQQQQQSYYAPQGTGYKPHSPAPPEYGVYGAPASPQPQHQGLNTYELDSRTH